ncbi:hypothetical protein G6F22_016267 [Rhizopus arrhizus]|nr:hypothetical protein G6F22_016267 [Rhizopus arrhizus]
MGYPNAQAERELLRGTDRRDLIARAVPKLDDTQVRALREAVGHIHASDALVDYVQALLTRSRQHAGVRVGLSPRAGLALLRAAKAHALLLGRSHVVPEDVQTLPSRWTEGDHALGPSTAAGTSAPARNAAAAARPPSHLCAAHAFRAVRRHPADRDAAGGVELQQQPGTAAGTAAGRRGDCQCHRRAPAAFRCTGRCDLGRTGCGRATAAPARGPVAA